MVILILMILAFVAVHALVGSGGGARISAFVPVGITAFVLFLLVQVELRKWGRSRLLVRPDGIVRESGKLRHEVPWEEIKKVRIHQDSRGTPGSVQVFPRTGPSFLLAGFEAMPDLVALVQAGLPTTVPVEVKRHRWSLENPFLFAAFLAVCLIVAQGGVELLKILIERFGLKDFPAELWLIAAAIALLTTSFMPQVRPRPRRGNLIFGILMLAWALASLLFRAFR